MALPLLILFIFFAGPGLFVALTTLVLFIGLLEFNRMGLADQLRLEQRLAALAGAALLPVLHLQRFDLLLALLTLALLLLCLLFLFRFADLSAIIPQLGWLLLGLLYLPLLLGHLVLLRQLPDGREWIFLTLLVVMACDSFAYFTGVNLGRRKLYPAVSPNKSIEGGIGGLVGAVVAVLLAGFTFLPVLGVLDAILIGLLLGVAGQLGDLFESLLKRACGVKDSGSLFPGHGGLLDRLDSLLFAFPLAYFIARYCYGG